MHSIRVLIVEDNEETAVALTMLLERAGHVVQWTRSAAETLDSWRSSREARCTGPDVLIMDLMLPDASGPRLIEALEEIGPLPPVIVHSAASDLVLIDAAAKVHAAATLRKPVEGKVIVSVIEEVAARFTNGRDVSTRSEQQLRMG